MRRPDYDPFGDRISVVQEPPTESRLDVDALEQAVRTVTNRHGLGITITANGQWFGRPRFTAEVAAEYDRLSREP
jgi:hypothetical protein